MAVPNPSRYDFVYGLTPEVADDFEANSRMSGIPREQSDTNDALVRLALLQVVDDSISAVRTYSRSRGRSWRIRADASRGDIPDG